MKATPVNIYLMQRGIQHRDICQRLDLDKTTVSLLLAGKIKIEARLNQVATLLGITRRRLDNLIEQSKTCPEQRRGIQNPKLVLSKSEGSKILEGGFHNGKH